MPVGVMLAQTTSAELAEYMAMERVDGPIGEVRADLRAGIVASTIANHGMSPPRSPLRPLDFMPFAKRQRVRGPIRLADPKAQQRLLEQTLFGTLLKKG